MPDPMPPRPRAPLVVTALLTLAAAARAQQPRDSVVLAPIVVTATRVATPADALPTAVTILDGAALRAAGHTTLAEALRTVPSAAFAQAGAFGGVTSLFLRGGQSGYVRVLVDGVVLNQAGGAVDLAVIPLTSVERIEVARGPASVLYGSDAVTGVIQVFTRRGAGAVQVDAAAAAGSHGLSELRAEAAAASPAAAWTVSASASGGDGVYAFNNDWHTAGAEGRLALTPDAHTDVQLTLRYADHRYAYPTDGGGTAVDSNQQQRTRTVLAGLDAGRRLGSRAELRLLLGLRASRDTSDDAPDAPGDTLGIFASWAGSRTERRSVDARLSVDAPGGAVVTVGGALERERERSANGYDSEFGAGQGALDVTRTNRALYLQALSARQGRLGLQGGARLDDNAAFGTFATWRFGASATLGGGLRLRGAAGTAFKEPTFIENYAAGYAVGNPALRPERSSSWEAGVEQRLAAGRIQLAATWFDQQFRDVIQYAVVPAQPNGPNFYNVAAADARGLEAEARFLPRAAVDVTVQYTWLHTSASDSGFGGGAFAPGQPLLRRPAHSGSVTALLQPAGRWSGGARVLAIGPRDDLDFGTWPATRVTLPGYVRTDLWAEVALRRGPGAGVALTLRVDNVTDAVTTDVLGFATPGRVIRLGARAGTPR